MVYTIATKSYFKYQAKKVEKENFELLMKRQENLKIIEVSDLSYLKDLRFEQQTFTAIREIKELYPHHMWLVKNEIECSELKVEKRYQELNTQL